MMVSNGLRNTYYKFVFGRRFPFASDIDCAIHAWERRHSKGDIPKAREDWDAQYQTSKWAFMRGLDESSRYAVIIAYMSGLKPKGAILDVGCGDGILFERYRPYGYLRYVGLDISEVALAKLSPKQDARTTFLCADAENYQPTELFDTIVFSESQYYFSNPVFTLRRYGDSLKPDGVMVLSTYTRSHRAMAILRCIKRYYSLVAETNIRQGASSWCCTVLALQAESQSELRRILIGARSSGELC